MFCEQKVKVYCTTKNTKAVHKSRFTLFTNQIKQLN